MKIAHVVCTYPPYYGGMGGVAFQTASALTARGHEVEVFTPQYEKEPPAEDVAYARRLEPSFQYGNTARLPQLTTVLTDFDLVHLHYPFFGTANLVRRWKKKNPDKPLVITYHMDTRSPGWKGLAFALYAKFWMPPILKRADAIIGSSFDYIEASDARKFFERDRAKWHELPFGVDTDRFAPQQLPKDLFTRYALNPEIPTVIFVGGMDAAHHFKGIHILLKALLLLHAQEIQIQAVFVGDGELREDYALQASSYGLDQYVRFVGRISDEELPRHYAMADLCVLPSIHRGEAFGMVLLESMATGVPVIASDLPGVRKVAESAGHVFPVKDAEALADLIGEYIFAESNLRDNWAAHAREVAEEEYSWPVIAAELERLYLSLLAS